MKIKFPKVFYVFLGLFLALVIYGAEAAWNTTVSSGTTLTSALWNDMINKLIELDSRGVGIEAGTVANNGTVPVPAGFSRSQCRAIVSFGVGSTHAGTSWPTNISVLVSQATGIVSCYTVTTGSGVYPGTCNYLIVCKK